MPRFLFTLLLLVAATLGAPATWAQSATKGLPARPSPFRFVTDEANLLSAADAKTLESGLRRYADNTGTQIVVVTVPTLGGREVADYARALGESWGVGQRDKNNGVVLLLAGQEHKVSIQAGSGLRDRLTPAVISRVINEKMTPSFKQGNYFAGLRSGLNTLMAATDPNPKKDQSQTSAATAATGAAASSEDVSSNLATTPAQPETAPYSPTANASDVSSPTPSAGLGIGTLLIGALVVGGVIWFLVRMFRRRAGTTPTGESPSFYPNSPGNQNQGGNYNRGPMGPQGNGSAPNFYPNQPGNMGGMGNMGGGGSGIGGILATGAAAAAGAYIGNRMASGGHDTTGSGLSEAGLGGAAGNLTPPTNYSGTPSGEFPALGGTGNNDSGTEPDYFSNDAGSDDSGDYFAADDNSYNDTSSDDVGGGGFDDNDDNSGSW
ncbi:TPM domain-containing protein [Hymenobacter crusticola]|uniref:TPM domain-containing protein n=1 Tax=Hymenobacter crusticola TaxID=1770526 RepID=A0A243WKH2_9BACT|nr:TPM domain-containing protein [Hymenobacter crusticola]OUJ76110.1 hypothetical protein BXP70_02200 [Hymenobacter crusticola]